MLEIKGVNGECSAKAPLHSITARVCDNLWVASIEMCKKEI